jgi:preprotein translocase subunit Sec61beta
MGGGSGQATSLAAPGAAVGAGIAVAAVVIG